jgi:hemerythrin-like domain-containing protein
MTESLDSVCEAGKRVINRIKAEHVLLARIIAAMQAWVVQCREPGAAADTDLFEAMLRYVEEVPDRVHHPQEDQVLFPVVARAAGTKQVIAELEREHASGATMLNALRQAYRALRDGKPNALNQLSTAVDEFAEFYWAHMRKEEESLLPLAAAGLTRSQWEEIDGAFVAVNDPLFGSELSQTYRRLYDYIAARMPEPLKGFVQAAAFPRP